MSALLLLVTALQQQPALHSVETKPGCPACRVAITPVVTLGSAADPVISGDLSTVARDSRGDFYVVSSALRQPVLKYDAKGRFLGTIGRQGEGPGEFRWAREVKVWNDTLHVIDPVLGRLTKFSPGGKYISSREFPVGTDGTVKVGRELVVFARYFTPEGAGLPAHVVGAGRQLKKSFGASDPTIDPNDAYSGYRFISPSGDTAVWLNYVNRYQVDLYSLQGRHLASYARHASWFPRWSDAGPRADMAPPKPRLECVQEDSRGNIMTVVHVAQWNWKAGTRLTNAEVPILPDVERDLYWDTIVELIDPRRAVLLASTRYDGYYDCYLSNGQNLLTSRSRNDDGAAIHVWRMASSYKR